MRNHTISLGTLVIASAGSDSTSLVLDRKGQVAITIHAPSALTGAITVQVATRADPATWRAYHGTTGAAITIAAGTSVTITPVAFSSIRVQSGGVEAAERTFYVEGVEDINP